MRDSRQIYTAEEDAIILSYVKEAQAEGLPVATAYIKIADEITRPVGSVSNRHGRIMKKLNAGEELKYKNSNKIKQKGLSDSELIILKLKALKRDKLRSAEKTDMYKDQYKALSKEHETLQKNYQSLKAEYDKVIKMLKETLLDDEHEVG
jgi:hypothetical protein